MKKLTFTLLILTFFTAKAWSVETTQGDFSLQVLKGVGVAIAEIKGEAAKEFYDFLKVPEQMTNPLIKIGENISCEKHTISQDNIEYKCTLLATEKGMLEPDLPIDPVGGFTISN